MAHEAWRAHSLTASASGREKPGSKLRPLSTSRLFPKRQRAGAVKDLADIPLLVDLGKAWESGETPLPLCFTACAVCIVRVGQQPSTIPLFEAGVRAIGS